MSDIALLHQAARAARDEHTPGRPVARPRLASTLVLVREGPGGPEILTGRRSAKHRFMPNKYVFPGGRVDREDASAPADGPLSPHDQAILSRRLAPARCRAAPLAAIRETFEETGVLVGAPSEGEASPPTPGGASGPCWSAFANAGLAPAVSRLKVLGRAITPTSRPIRFDTYFFVARMEEVVLVGEAQASAELEAVGWRTIEETRRLDLPTITRFVLEQADAFMTRGAPPIFVRTVGGRGRASVLEP